MPRSNPTVHQCALCERPFLKKSEAHRYCDDCRIKMTRNMRSSKPMLRESCMVCGKKTRLTRKEVKEIKARGEKVPPRLESLCSERCRKVHKIRTNELKICQLCLQPFQVNNLIDAKKRMPSTYCKKCSSHKYKQLNKEQKEVLAIAKKQIEDYIFSLQTKQVEQFIDEMLGIKK